MNLFLIFVIAFGLNFIWEYFHSKLYVAYKGSQITIPILLHAAVFDAFFITALYFLFPNSQWLSASIAFLFAVGLEKFALKTNRWQYKPSMPIIPVLEVGLTPVIQLPLLTYIVFIFSAV